jgi:EmrB/QacA subfamily drug resistance transporter
MHEESGVKKWLPLAVLALALFIVVLDTTIINVSIKSIITDLQSNLKAVQWVITGYSLVLAAFTITGGRLGDILGRKRMFIVGAVIFAIGSLMASRAHSASFLLLSVSLVEGLGASLMLPATASLILSQYRGKDRALAFGVYGAIAGAAATIGPILGGYLTTNFSWRWNYLINPLVVLVLLAGSFLIHEAHERSPHKPDLLSILLSALGLAGVVYGVIESSTYGWAKSKTDFEIFTRTYHLGGISISSFTIVVGLIFIGLFLWHQKRLEKAGKTPLVSSALLRNKQFMSGTVVLMVAVLGQFGLVFALPVFLQGLLGKDAFHSGIATLPLSIGILFASPISGILASKKNVAQRYLIQAGLVITIIGGVLLYTEVSATSTTLTFVPGLALFGVGFGLIIAQLTNLTLSAVSVNMAGEASGVNNTFRQIGTSLGQALIGAVLISSLAAQLNTDVVKSKILPFDGKVQIARAVGVSAESLGAAQAPGASILSPAAGVEVARIKNDAIVKGVKTAFAATVGATIVALGLSTQLPKRAQQHDYEKPDAPSAG